MLMLFFLLFYNIMIFLIFLLLFVCVFIHEAAHAYTARKNNIKVKDILLTPLGGATSLDNDKIDRKQELNIAISGPLMSVFLGGVFGILSVFAPMGNFVFVLQELFILNVALGILNLLPAFPLDGGRVFRSYLEKKRNMLDSTMLTGKISKYVAIIIVIGSVGYLWLSSFSLTEKILDFVIFAFVGFILYGGAVAEMQNAILTKKTEKMAIKGAVDKRFVLIGKNTTIKDLYQIMEGRGTSIAITKNGKDFMLLDLFRKNVNPDSNITAIATPVPQFNSGTNILSAIRKIEMEGKPLGVVSKNGRAIGIVTLQHMNAMLSLKFLGNKEGV